jgi:hypothetical protein
MIFNGIKVIHAKKNSHNLKTVSGDSSTVILI